MYFKVVTAKLDSTIYESEITFRYTKMSISKGRGQGVEKWMIYQEVHRLKKMRFSNSKIAKKLKVSRNRMMLNILAQKMQLEEDQVLFIL